MNLDFDETQLMLRTQARDFIAEKCPMTLVRELASNEQAYSAEVWQGMAELGWMSIPFPEEHGGVEMSFFEVLILLEEMGRGAVPSPFLSTMLCGLAISEFGSGEQKNELLPPIVNGELICALAWTEPSASLKPSGITLEATRSTGSEYSLTGTKLFCADAHIADKLLVVARTAPAATDNLGHGITLFVIPARDPAVQCSPQDTIGFDQQCEVKLANLVVEEKDIVGKVNEGWPIVRKLMEWGAMAKCAEMVGAATKAFEMSLDYAKDRVQYGKAIGTFQKQQHRLADMWIALEGGRNYYYETGWFVSNGEADPQSVSLAKAIVSEMAEELANQAILLHGAIGLTWDYDLGFLARRIKAAAIMFGSPRYHREQVARTMEAEVIVK